jgi:hypothetical protein
MEIPIDEDEEFTFVPDISLSKLSIGSPVQKSRITIN